MNPSPLPQPAAQTCPNCGAAASEGVNFCPHCGAPLSTNARSGGVWFVLGQIALAFGAVCSGLSGACFVLLGGGTFGGGFSFESFFMLAIGVAGVVIASLCIRKMMKSGRRNP